MNSSGTAGEFSIRTASVRSLVNARSRAGQSGMVSTPVSAKPWHARSSPLARGALVVYVLLVLYSGLAPWSGWRDLGVAPFAYLTAPVPRHVTTFDVL